jgi:hypothetical protein
VVGGGVVGGGSVKPPPSVPPKAGKFMRLMPPLEIKVFVARVRVFPLAPFHVTNNSTLAKRCAAKPFPADTVVRSPFCWRFTTRG